MFFDTYVRYVLEISYIFVYDHEVISVLQYQKVTNWNPLASYVTQKLKRVYGNELFILIFIYVI